MLFTFYETIYAYHVSSINFHTKEISVKIVYYGPGLCGKTTSLHAVYNSLPMERRNQFVSLNTEVDRTIFFDFLPITAYRIREFTVRLQLYTVPGQVFYNATRRLVLNGVDGVVLVMDSQTSMRDSNIEAITNLDENLESLGMDPTEVPMVIQANKRDLPAIDDLTFMDHLYNRRQVPFFATTATTGEGITDSLRSISQGVIKTLLASGLGEQIVQDESARNKSATPDLGGLHDQVAAAATASVDHQASEPIQSAAPPAVAKVAQVPIGMWPNATVAAQGNIIQMAVAEGRWREALLAAEGLIHDQAQAWAQDTGFNVGDPVSSFLLLRGASKERYQAMSKALRTARTGAEIDRDAAMAALILALESLW